MKTDGALNDLLGSGDDICGGDHPYSGVQAVQEREFSGATRFCIQGRECKPSRFCDKIAEELFSICDLLIDLLNARLLPVHGFRGEE